MAEKNFEQQVAELEAIVKKLEGGDVSLDEAMKLFEDGMILAKNCREMLDKAQLKVKALVEKADGVMAQEDFDTNIKEG